MTLPAAPPVPLIPAGYEPFQADFNAWVTTPFSFVSTAPVFRGQLQGTQALTAATWTLAQLDTVLEDPYGGWSAVTTANQPAFSWLCPPGCSGMYEVSMCGMCAGQASATALIGAAVYVDGSLWQEAGFMWADDGNTGGAAGAVPVPLQGGSDYVQMYIFTTLGVNTPALAGRFPYMEIAWLSS